MAQRECIADAALLCSPGSVYAVIHRAEAAPASQYGFASDFCHANDPQSKGIVENGDYAQQHELAAPLLIQAAIDGAASGICGSRTLRPRRGAAEVNAAVHSQIWRCLMSS